MSPRASSSGLYGPLGSTKSGGGGITEVTEREIGVEIFSTGYECFEKETGVSELSRRMVKTKSKEGGRGIYRRRWSGRRESESDREVWNLIL